jgi:hypothetical protein
LSNDGATGQAFYELESGPRFLQLQETPHTYVHLSASIWTLPKELGLHGFGEELFVVAESAHMH